MIKAGRAICGSRPTAPVIIIGTFVLFFVFFLVHRAGGTQGIRLPNAYLPGGSPSSKGTPPKAGIIAKPFVAPAPPKAPIVFTPNPDLTQKHHIFELVDEAQKFQEDLTEQATSGVEAAADAYRRRRGRHPPPGFDNWVKFAEENGAIMVESFFDRMHEDIEPFWGKPAFEIRTEAASWPNILAIRDGHVTKYKLNEGYPEWLSRWKDMIEHIPSEYLPDIDLAFNPDDEPHTFISYKERLEHLERAEKTKNTDPPGVLNEMYDDFATIGGMPSDNRTWKGFWDGLNKANSESWYFSRAACPEESPARRATLDGDESRRPEFPDLGNVSFASYGYVRNFSQSKSVCYNPLLRSNHGYFIYPKETTFLAVNLEAEHTLWDTRALTRRYFPLLSGCKLGDVNGEILVPAAMNWALRDEMKGVFEWEEDNAHQWEDKQDKVMWRGVATGGFATKTNWRRFPRYRLVSMLNATQIEIDASVLADGDVHHDERRAADFPYPNVDLYQMTETSVSKLAAWIRSIADVAFTLVPVGCWPPGTPASDCKYAEDKYQISERVPFMDFFKNKYLADVDGGSYSGRFRALIMSNSVPIKATIWSEWHDSRLVPWQHFVPMDNSMGDLWGILDFFLGRDRSAEDKAERDAVGKAIATQGRDWAEKVMRREDMQVWMFRLILELARIYDDRREQMGYTQDLTDAILNGDGKDYV